MKWQQLLMKPAQHEMNGAIALAQLMLNDPRVDALSKYALNEHLVQMQNKTDILLNSKFVA